MTKKEKYHRAILTLIIIVKNTQISKYAVGFMQI